MMGFPRAMLALLLLLSVSCGKEKPAPHPLTPVTFAAFGNTGLVTDNGLVFSELAGAVNRLGIDFAVDLGNRLPMGASSTGLEALFSAVDCDMEKFAVPVYPVAGATDVFDASSDVAYGSHYGPSWYSFARGGMTFIALHTGDESYRFGFGVNPRIGDEQLEWLRNTLLKTEGSPVVLFMNRPLWEDSPGFWRDRLLPVFRSVHVVLAVTCSREGLYDWGKVDGIRAVSTGCTGPMDRKGIGLAPHALIVRVLGDTVTFRVLGPDGAVREGVGITSETKEKINRFVRLLEPPAVKAMSNWKVSDTFDLSPENPFPFPVSGALAFTVFKNTAWSIRPPRVEFVLEPNMTRTFHVDVQGSPPELGPQPSFSLNLKAGDTELPGLTGTLAVKIPPPRTGNPVSVSARIAGRIPYAFDGGSLRIAVDVEDSDLCGRMAIYRTESVEIPVCIHISNLVDFRRGANEFVWNGRDLRGNRVARGPLACFVFVYNKKAPVTWVADGPPHEAGTLIVAREPAGLVSRTHTERSLAEYPVGRTFGEPKAELPGRVDEILDGLSIRGFTGDRERRVFFTVDAGVVCTFVSGGRMHQDISFADKGYLRFTAFRGRMIGAPAYGGGKLYIGVGGGMGEGPAVIVVNGETGKIVSRIDLESYYGREPEPPALSADDGGIVVAHPSGDVILRLSHDSTILWINESGDEIGDVDADGRSFVYGIGADQFGMSYVTSTGTSARCGVLGPDGRGLFRVILVQLPGLRVSSVFPMIEGKPSDGLYLVTRGGDHPYVFHVPYTIRSGEIVEKGGER
jgi:hypothetical protein